MDKRILRNMTLFLSGQFASLFGSSIYSFAISLYILKSTGSGLNFSLSLVLSTLPRVLCGPIAGVVADRFDRKTLVVVLDTLAGVLVLGVLALSLNQPPNLLLLYATTFLLSTISTFYGVALMASTPNLVDEKHLMQINSLSQAVSSSSGIAGPFLGGLCYAVMDLNFFFLLNGLSFIISAVAALFINFNLANQLKGIASEGSAKKKASSAGKNAGFKGFLKDMGEGLTYMKSERWLITFTSFCVLFNFFIMIGLTVPMPYIVNKVWGFTPQQYGLLNMTFPIGMLITSLAISVLPQPKSLYKQIIGSIGLFSVGIMVVGLVASEIFYKGSNTVYLILLMGCYMALAAASMLINIPIGVALQVLVPDDKRGRVQGTLGTLVQAFGPLGAIIAGLLVDKITPWVLPMTCGLVMAILTVIMSKEETIKTLRMGNEAADNGNA